MALRPGQRGKKAGTAETRVLERIAELQALGYESIRARDVADVTSPAHPSGVLRALYDQGLLWRSGKKHSYRYKIAIQGRERAEL